MSINMCWWHIFLLQAQPKRLPRSLPRQQMPTYMKLCPKYVCPADLKAEHDKLVAKRNLQRERERTEQQRQKAIEDEKNYLKAKGIFFGLVFSDSLICIKVIESVEEMEEEGRIMHHCVGGYHNKANSLILSATIEGKRIETIEVSLKTLKVVFLLEIIQANGLPIFILVT